MQTIGLEEHFWTEALADAQANVSADRKDDNTPAFQEPEIAGRLQDLGHGRLREMDRIGIDRMVLSTAAPGVQNLPAEVAVPLARQTNDALAAAVRAHPDRLSGFAMLPTPDPDAAVQELTRCIQELGMPGAMINGRTGDDYLDHPKFRSVLGAAEQMGVPIYLHPQIAPRAVRNVYYDGFGDKLDTVFASPGWGWHMDAGIGALRLILAGVFDEFPSLQIILGHWGEMVTFYLDRTETLSKVATHLKRPVPDYFRHNFYVTGSGMYTTPHLQRCVEVLGPDRVMCSSDYPFRYFPDGLAKAFLEEAPLPLEVKHKIAHGNAEKLLKLK